MWLFWLALTLASLVLAVRFGKGSGGLRRAVLWGAVVLTALSYPARNLPMRLMGMYPLDDPAFVSADEARLEEEEMVLGVVVGNESRAYPLRWLRRHEIVNDQIAATPLVATY